VSLVEISIKKAVHF